MASGWTVTMGPQGAALNDYRGYADLRFVDYLYDFGAAKVILTSLDGHAAPATGWVIRLIFDKGLATEQVHWEGIIASAEKKQQGSVYVIQAYTVDSVLNVNQTGAIRNYPGQTPYQIIATSTFPSNNLLVNAQGATVMTYGSSASVPNKVETANDRMGSFSGTIGNDQFVAHSRTILDNVKRLCWQGRYTFDAAPDGSSNGDLDGSYGLEWTARLEGANNSSPRFYLVKRRESRVSYTPEVYAIPTDLHRSSRGNPTFPGVDTVLVVGSGDGNSRIVSALAGSGTREMTLDDKAIYTATNATNFAQRALQVYGVTTEAITGATSRHASPTRAGDTIRVQQAGFADQLLRVMARFYDTQSKMFTYQVGRPQPKTREALQGQMGFSSSVGTAPQATDLRVHSLFPSGLNLFFLPFGGANPTNVAAGTTVAGAAVAAPVGWDGDMEGFFATMQLVVNAAHTPRNGGTAEILIQFDFATSPGVYQTLFVQSFGEPGVGTGNPVQDTNQTYNSYPYKVNLPGFTDVTILTGRIAVRNRGNANLAIDGVNTLAGVYRTPKHRHNEL